MFVCKSMTLANYLLSHGSKLIKIDKDKKSGNDYLVFLFLKNDLLNKNLEKWRISN